MAHEGRISAIILAAGMSRRMGQFKPLLKIGSQTFLERLATSFRNAGTDQILVVTGYKQAALMSLIKELQLEYAYNPRYREEMLLSVQCGAEALQKSCRGFFAAPVDVPGFKSSTLEKQITAFNAGKGKIIYPVCHGKRGHPPLIAAELRPFLLQWRGPAGLYGFLRQYDNEAWELPVDDPAILKDYDTPKDLAEPGISF